MKLNLQTFNWAEGYGYIIEPDAEDYYFVISFRYGDKLVNANKVYHKHREPEPEVKSFPKEVSRRFIMLVFGDGKVNYVE